MPLIPIRRRVAFIPVFVPSYLLLSVREAMAHADHYQTEQPEQPPSDSTRSERLSEPVGTLDATENESITAAEKDSAAQLSVSVSESSSISSNGFAGTGLGESLLALIIAAPFVLRVVKRRLKP